MRNKLNTVMQKLRFQLMGEMVARSIAERGLVTAVTCLSGALLLYGFYYLANIYLPVAKQYLVGWGLVLLLILFWKTDKFSRPPLRVLFILLCIFVSIRYMLWRTCETLVYDGVVNFIGMMLLYLAEVYALTVHLLGAFANIWPLETKIHPLPEDTARYPSVDIFIPTYNEDIEMVKVTTIAALNIDYPKDKLHIHILDDGATDDKRNDPKSSKAAWERYYRLGKAARELGVNYIARQQNSKAKAGNLNYALAQTGADLILVLDCDHVPTKDILKNTVGWFLKDEKLAFVQTPHFFINPDPVEKNIDILKDAPSENEMFYRACHLGLNFWNSSFFCGSAAILRRKYLDEVGGISGETITEDCETALALHQRGYNSVFIARPMVCGLSPETFDDFILQRSRWAQGMTQMMVLNNPLFVKGLSFYQRICYFNNGLFWFFGIPRFIFMVAPAAFLLLNLHVYFASVSQVVAFAVPHLIASVILADFLYGKYRWPFLSELYESIQSIFLMPVVLSVFFNPRKPSFKVTPKGKSLESDFLSGLSVPFFMMCSFLLMTLPIGIYKFYQYPLYRDVTMITLTWSLFNLCLAMAAFGAFYEKKQIRRNHRMWTKGKVQVYIPRLEMSVEAEALDISLSGMGISFVLSADIMPKEPIRFDARDSSGEKFLIDAQIQRSVLKEGRLLCGTEFVVANEKQKSNVIRYVYSDSQRWVDYWGKNSVKPNPFKVLAFVFKMSLKGFKISMIACLELLIVPALNLLNNFRHRFLTKTEPSDPG